MCSLLLPLRSPEMAVSVDGVTRLAHATICSASGLGYSLVCQAARAGHHASTAVPRWTQLQASMEHQSSSWLAWTGLMRRQRDCRLFHHNLTYIDTSCARVKTSANRQQMHGQETDLLSIAVMHAMFGNRLHYVPFTVTDWL